MKLSGIANMRLYSQQIAASKFKKPKELVKWMGAMQAQDYNMAKWAIGIRLPGSTDDTVEDAVTKGQIIRTHLMRPTWHFVSSEDIYWMLELTGPQIKTSLKTREKQLGITEKILAKSSTIIQKALTANKYLTREELATEVKRAKIATHDNRLSHLLIRAELEGIICNGATKGTNRTYALLENVVPKIKKLNRDEALATLAKRYFSSHCPATLQDFTWWSGLPVRDAKSALEMIKRDFISETIESQTYWLPNSFSIPEKHNKACYLLPAYDEFMISYKDRSASLNIEDHKRSISGNGIFYPVIALHAQITGMWKRTLKNEKIIIETQFFRRHTKVELSMIKKAAKRFENFLEKKSELEFASDT
jgi:hypothetical protein